MHSNCDFQRQELFGSYSLIEKASSELSRLSVRGSIEGQEHKFEQAVLSASSSVSKPAILDLTHVDYVSNSALWHLTRINSKFDEKGTKLVFLISPKNEAMKRWAGLNWQCGEFTFAESIGEAVSLCQRDTPETEKKAVLPAGRNLPTQKGFFQRDKRAPNKKGAFRDKKVVLLKMQ